MNIYLHEGYLEERKARAKRLQTIGIVLIAISFVLSLFSFNIEYAYLIFLAYPFLLVGFPIWTMGRNAVRRLAGPQPDGVLNTELRGLNAKYSLHHYAKIGETYVPHMLITPDGIVAIVTSDAAGPVTCKGGQGGDQWRSQSNFLDRMTGLKPPVGNPSLEVQAATAAVRSLLEQIGKPKAPVKGLAVFTRNPDITISECSFTGVPMSEVREAMAAAQADMGGEPGGRGATALTTEDRRKLDSALAPTFITTRAGAEPPKTSRPARPVKR
ncbi:MAG TPA: hypothetical protein VFR15_04100 [Chloroflexia bacterium]|nr:hypothetical protein [Chloroflexia bacterium]